MLVHLVRCACLALLLACAAAGTAAAAPGRKVALVVGNATYVHATRLTNPLNDAADLAAALKRLGFEVIVAGDLNSDAFHDTVSKISKAVEGADLALFFYAGHAVQYEGVNYLLPVDIKIDTAYDLKRKAVVAHDIVEVLQRGARASIMLLDACRNNTVMREYEQSLPEKTRSAGQSRGLARMDVRDGNTLVGFATAPNEVATDGNGRNSPYSAALLKHIEKPGVDVLQVLTAVSADVRAATRNNQRPEFLSKLIESISLAPREAVKTPETSREREASVAWQAAGGSCVAGDLRDFHTRYRDTYFGDLATRRLADIEAGRVCRAPDPAAVPTSTPVATPTPAPPEPAAQSAPEPKAATITPPRPEPKTSEKTPQATPKKASAPSTDAPSTAKPPVKRAAPVEPAPQRNASAGRCAAWNACIRNVQAQRDRNNENMARLQKCGVAPSGC